MKIKLRNVIISAIKIFCVICAVLALFVIILFQQAAKPSEVRLINQAISPDNNWVAYTNYEDGEGFLMFTPPFYTIYIEPRKKDIWTADKKKILKIECNNKDAPAIKWQNNNVVIIDNIDTKADIYLKVKKYRDIDILYK